MFCLFKSWSFFFFFFLFLKLNTGGEDAFLVSNYNGGVIAVAVSGYATFLLYDSCTMDGL